MIWNGTIEWSPLPCVAESFLESKLFRERYLNLKKGVCPLDWVIMPALTVVDETPLRLQPSSDFTRIVRFPCHVQLDTLVAL